MCKKIISCILVVMLLCSSIVIASAAPIEENIQNGRMVSSKYTGGTSFAVCLHEPNRWIQYAQKDFNFNNGTFDICFEREICYAATCIKCGEQMLKEATYEFEHDFSRQDGNRTYCSKSGCRKFIASVK